MYSNINYRILNPNKVFNTFRISLGSYFEFYKPTNQIPVGVSPSQFGSDTFMTFNKIKLDLIEKIRLEVPSSVKYITYMDGDIIVFKDFIPHIKEQFSASDSIILFQNDDLYKQVNTRANGCTGFFCIRRSFLIQSPFYIDDNSLWKQLREDQVWVNKKLVDYSIPFEYLERELFPNGIYLKEERWKKLEPYLIHYNHLVGNSKISMMKRNKHWLIVY